MRSPGTPLDGVAGWGVCVYVCVERRGRETSRQEQRQSPIPEE